MRRDKDLDLPHKEPKAADRVGIANVACSGVTTFFKEVVNQNHSIHRD
jgi:hypothetical protein